MALSNRNNLGGGASPAGEYVEVIADGVKTYEALLNELFSNINASKVSTQSTLAVIETGDVLISNLCYTSNAMYIYTRSQVDTSNGSIVTYRVSSTGSTLKRVVTTGTVTDYSASVPTSGIIIRLFY